MSLLLLFQDHPQPFVKGVDLMIRASELNEVEANLHLAQIYDKGLDASV